MQSKLVKTYFDSIGARYSGRYSSKAPFHEYIFKDRLKNAIKYIEKENPSILDIGAGSGALYQWLKINLTNVNYSACDISYEMLSHGDIPETCYEIGTLSQTSYINQQFDYVFMLGVSTYMKPDELRHTLKVISNCLEPGGKAVVSFTNRSSMNWYFHNIFNYLLRSYAPFKDKFIGQRFETYAYTPSEINCLLPEGIVAENICGVSPCIPVLSSLLPSIGIPIAKHLQGKTIYLDFLLILRRQ